MFGQHAVCQQYEFGAATAGVRLELVTQLATCYGAHILLTDDDIGIQRLDIGQRVLHIVVSVEIIDIAQVEFHEVQELVVGIDKDDTELLRLFVDLQRAHIDGQFTSAGSRQSYLTAIVQLQLVLSSRFSLLLRILQRALHLRDTRDDLQHLEVERVQLLAALQRLFSLSHIADDGCHAGHGLA